MSTTRRGKIRKELTLGLIAVILLSGLATYVVVLLSFRRDFDTLVEQNDIDIAKTFAASLAKYYESTGSWVGVEVTIDELKHTPVSLLTKGDPRFPEKKHPKDSDIPLLLTDVDGDLLYSGIRTRDGEGHKLPTRLKTSDGEKIIANGTTVAYVFFKSMIVRSYNPQEQAFISSLTRSIGLSVLIGIIFAFLLGTALASRFARPIVSLDTAVKRISGGDLSARVSVLRGDEIGSLADSFNLMADKLQITENSRQNLLADIAHELRTPVSIIQANLEMIIDGVYEADRSRLKSLYEETRILTSLISNLRSLSDLEVGLDPLRLDRVRLSALVDESCRKLKPLFDERLVQLELPHAADELRVLADEDKLRQVLRNILGNALKYAPSNSLVAVSLVPVQGPDGRPSVVRTTILDEGEGVPDSDTEKIFERFYRVDPSRNRESGGRGLGLAICKEIVEAFHGKIGAYNRDPHGLAVWFELPMDEAASVTKIVADR